MTAASRDAAPHQAAAQADEGEASRAPRRGTAGMGSLPHASADIHPALDSKLRQVIVHTLDLDLIVPLVAEHHVFGSRGTLGRIHL